MGRCGSVLTAEEMKKLFAGMFSAVDCTLVYLRKKEDFWNAIISGGATGALLTIRQGPATMAMSAGIGACCHTVFFHVGFHYCAGAILLAMIEGVGVVMNRMSADQFDMTQAPLIEDPSQLGDKPSTSQAQPGLFSGLFGGGDDASTYKPHTVGI